MGFIKLTRDALFTISCIIFIGIIVFGLYLYLRPAKSPIFVKNFSSKRIKDFSITYKPKKETLTSSDVIRNKSVDALKPDQCLRIDTDVNNQDLEFIKLSYRFNGKTINKNIQLSKYSIGDYGIKIKIKGTEVHWNETIRYEDCEMIVGPN